MKKQLKQYLNHLIRWQEAYIIGTIGILAIIIMVSLIEYTLNLLTQ